MSCWSWIFALVLESATAATPGLCCRADSHIALSPSLIPVGIYSETFLTLFPTYSHTLILPSLLQLPFDPTWGFEVHPVGAFSGFPRNIFKLIWILR